MQKKYSKLNDEEKIRFKKKYCKVCGKELPFLTKRRLYHDKCDPDEPKTKRWR